MFKYFENLWVGKDGKLSARRALGLLFSTDLLINFHKLGGIATKVLNLLATNHSIDAQALSAISNSLANIAIIVGVEAGFVAALFSLTTYQTIEFNKADTITNAVKSTDDNVPAGQLPV